MQTLTYRVQIVRLLTLVLAAIALALATPHATHAAERAGSAPPAAITGDIDPDKLQTGFVTTAQKWATPLAVIGIGMALLAFLVVPILPDWAASMKGYIVRALLIIAVLSFVPSLVGAAKAIGTAEKFIIPFGLPVLQQTDTLYRRWERWYRGVVCGK